VIVRRAVAHRDGAIAFLVAAAPVVWLAAEQGGYFPEAWAGPTLVLLWIAMLTLVLGGARLPGRLSVATFGAGAALAAWIGVSASWSSLPSQSMLELERALLYVTVLLAALLVARDRANALLAGLLTAISVVCIYGLATRLFPYAFGVVEREPFQTAALAEPIGYSNALGAFAGLGVLLALGFAAEGSSRLSRSLAAAAVVPLATVVYLAFSRGAWFALAAGLVATVVVAPARARLLTAWLVGPLPFAVLGIAFASRAGALSRVDPPLQDAALQGALLFVALALLAAAAAGAKLAAPTLERRLGHIRPLLAVTLAVAVTLTAALTLTKGTPTRPATALRVEGGAGVALGHRDEFWGAAWNAFSERPLTGFGAGAFEQYWLQHREHRRNVRDAHNLYFETLAELGAPGLALLAALFGIPITAATLARRRPLVPAAMGALSVYLAHAVVDWDWEVPAVTVAALVAAVGVVTAADEEREPLLLAPLVRAAGVAVALAASVFSVVALVGNRAGAAAESALRAGSAQRAEGEARRAARWAPWSAHPLLTLAEAQLQQREREPARTTLHKALAKEDQNWRLWLALAVAADGGERREAFARAEMLNPLGRRIAELRPSLGSRGGFGRPA
jgi:hypothetical protein